MNEIAAMIGAAVTLLTFAANIFFQWRRDVRERNALVRIVACKHDDAGYCKLLNKQTDCTTDNHPCFEEAPTLKRRHG